MERVMEISRHFAPRKMPPLGALLERVNRIAFVGASIFNGFRASVQISSNFCSISSNRSLSGDVSFRSVGEKRNELPDFFPKAHVMEQVSRSAFLNTSDCKGLKSSI